MGLTVNQEKAINHKHIDGNAIVSASAGSGKTFVVIKRIIRLITEEDVKVNEILAVTFTNLAAGEMKEKLKSAIIKKINDKTTPLELKNRLKIELNNVNSADISTIHSFCLNTLKRYFYAIDIDATFEICDEAKSKKLKAQALENSFEKLYEEKDETFFKALDIYARGRNDRDLKNAVLDLATFVDSETGVEAVTEKTKKSTENVLNYLNGYLRVYYQNRLKHIYNKIIKIEGNFVGIEHREVQIQKFKDMLTSALNANNYFDLATALNNPKIYRKDAKTDDDKLLKAIHEDFEDLAVKITKLAIGGETKIVEDARGVFEDYKILVYVYQKFFDEFQKLKREENLVDFSDLEHFTYRLLQNEEVLNEIKSKYKYVFIDEYQDVNGVQEEIANLISSNNEFMVGDSKQSIYGFRGCNPNFFVEKNARYDSGTNEGVAIPLNKNFRSAENIIKTVNNVFTRIMTKDFGGHDYAKDPMVYGDGYFDEKTNTNYPGEAVLDLICDDLDEVGNVEPSGVYSVINADKRKKSDKEAGLSEKLIVQLIKDAIKKPYFDIKAKEERDEYEKKRKINKNLPEKNFEVVKEIDYKDIVILLRSFGNYGENLVNLLIKSGIPVSAESRDSIGEYPEIKTLVNLLKLTVNADNDVALANTLMEFWGLTESELTEIRLHGDAVAEENEKNFIDCKVNDNSNNKQTDSAVNDNFNCSKQTFESFTANKEVEFINDKILEVNIDNKSTSVSETECVIVTPKLNRYSSFYDCALSYSKTSAPLGVKLNEFFTYIEKIRILSDFITAGELLTKIISETGYDTRLIGSDFGEMKMRRVERFVSAAGNNTVAEFIEGIDDILEKLTVSEASGENTVKVMTMHASKGLEFPFVIIAGTDKQFNFQDAGGFFIQNRELGVSVQTINRDNKTIYKNAHYEILSKMIKEQAIYEEMRVFYVALTRAKHDLHIVALADNVLNEDVYIGNAMRESDFILPTDATVKEHFASSLNLGGQSNNNESSGNKIDDNLKDLIKRNLTLTYKYEKDVNLPVKSSVSTVNASDEFEYYETVSLFGESDAEKGTAYHKALELIDFYGDVESEYSSLVESGKITESEAELIDVEKLKRIIKIDVFNDIKNYKLYKELKFCQLVKPGEIGLEGEDSEILIQGIIDLVAVKDGECVLIDYKLSKIASDIDLISKYEKQLKLYALALEKILKLEVKKIYLVNILQEKSVEIC